MPRRCTVCDHDKRDELDLALAAGGNVRGLARVHRLTPQALRRHQASHVPAAIRRAAADKKTDSASALLAQVRDLMARTSAILEAAEQPETKLRAIEQVRRNLELIGRLTGQLQSGTSVSVQVGIWQRLGVKDEDDARRRIEASQRYEGMSEDELAQRMRAWLQRHDAARLNAGGSTDGP
jgi:hypothetical protein